MSLISSLFSRQARQDSPKTSTPATQENRSRQKRKDARASREAQQLRLRAQRRYRIIKIGIPLFALLIFGISAHVIWSHGIVQTAFQGTNDFIHKTILQAGLSVQHVAVTGRQETSRDKILTALDVDLGDSILSIDLDTAARRIREIGWVEDVLLQRRLPDTLHIDLRERTPLAIWQDGPKLVLIDANGISIGEDNLHKYRHLKIVMGPGAPNQAAHLLSILEKEPKLAGEVIAAEWIAQRRWSLKLANGIDIRLPEENITEAWKRLAQLERDHQLLARDITAIDLRQSDRLIVRMTKEAADHKHAHKDET